MKRRAGAHLRHQEDVALRQRQFVDLRLAVTVSEASLCCRRDADGGARDVDGFLECDHRERYGHFDGLPDAEAKFCLRDWPEALGLRDDAVNARREAGEEERTRFVRRRGPRRPSGKMLCRHGGPGQYLAKAVNDRSFERGFGQLSLARRREEESDGQAHQNQFRRAHRVVHRSRALYGRRRVGGIVESRYRRGSKRVPERLRDRAAPQVLEHGKYHERCGLGA